MRSMLGRRLIIGTLGVGLAGALLLKAGELVAGAAQQGAGAPATRLGAAIEDGLSNRARALEERERSLELRAAVAAATEKRAADRLQALAAERARLEQLHAAQKEAENARLQSLARVYAAMRPKEAALRLSELELDLQVDIAIRMKERVTANILGAMQPEAAAKLSAALARRPAQPSAEVADAARSS